MAGRTEYAANMQAPDAQVDLEDGARVHLRELYRDRPLALVFLRHFGCIFCRYQVSQLRPAADLNIAFVCMESASEAKEFKAKLRSPHRFISDPGHRLYEAFGVKTGTGRQLVTLNALKQGFKATLAGSFQGKPTADPMQLSAAFVIGTEGEVSWSHYAKDAGDIVSEEALRRQL